MGEIIREKGKQKPEPRGETQPLQFPFERGEDDGVRSIVVMIRHHPAELKRLEVSGWSGARAAAGALPSLHFPAHLWGWLVPRQRIRERSAAEAGWARPFSKDCTAPPLSSMHFASGGPRSL